MKQVENKQQNGRLNPKSSLITLKSKWITTPIKGRDFQTGQKSKTQSYAIYKRCYYKYKIPDTLKEKEWDKISHINSNQKRLAQLYC